MPNNVMIAVKKPRTNWEKMTVPDTLETYQRIVGGYIEHVASSDSGIQIFGNEEGLISNLPFNIRSRFGLLFGTLFAVRTDEEGEFQSLRDEDLEELNAARSY